MLHTTLIENEKLHSLANIKNSTFTWPTQKSAAHGNFRYQILMLESFGDESFSPWFRIPTASVYKSINGISYMLVCGVQVRAPAQHFDAWS